MRVIIAGSRSAKIYDSDITEAVHASGFQVSTLIHGGASGVDAAADTWADSRGILVMPYDIPQWVWDHLGPKAGPIRNSYMARDADALIAFPGGKGTANMVKQAREAGLKVYLHGWSDQ